VWTSILYVLLIFCSLILILLVLIQRGKGGGLAGAFGGMGGSSAFGAKAGDVFTKVTMYVAGVWIVISMFLVVIANQGHTSAWPGSTSSTQKGPPTTAGSKRTGQTGTSTGSSSAGKSLEMEPDSSDVPPPLPTAPKSSSQPSNPGDPLAPLPSPDSKPR